MSEKLLTIQQVAKVFEVSSQTVRNLCHSGKLPYLRFGVSMRVRESIVDDYIAKNTDSNNEKYIF